jgi:hypothetical protein
MEYADGLMPLHMPLSWVPLHSVVQEEVRMKNHRRNLKLLLEKHQHGDRCRHLIFLARAEFCRVLMKQCFNCVELPGSMQFGASLYDVCTVHCTCEDVLLRRLPLHTSYTNATVTLMPHYLPRLLIFLARTEFRRF